MLFIATCLSTFWVGTTNWEPHKYLGNMQETWQAFETNWKQGLAYMAAVIGILVAHEMGHFLQTIRYGVAASWPIFLPLPIAPTGTMGAVIVMDPSKADRKQLFDIGIWGPWAGLIVAVPMIWFGIKTATPDPTAGNFPFGTPLVFKLITAIARPDLQSTAVIKNPLFMAGWVGMLVTGLNMLPVSQLDGGHVIYGLFGTHSRLIVRAFIIAAIGFIIITEQYNWVVMLVLVLMLGIDHPPTRDDSVKLGPVHCDVWTDIAVYTSPLLYATFDSQWITGGKDCSRRLAELKISVLRIAYRGGLLANRISCVLSYGRRELAGDSAAMLLRFVDRRLSKLGQCPAYMRRIVLSCHLHERESQRRHCPYAPPCPKGPKPVADPAH